MFVINLDGPVGAGIDLSFGLGSVLCAFIGEDFRQARPELVNPRTTE